MVETLHVDLSPKNGSICRLYLQVDLKVARPRVHYKLAWALEDAGPSALQAAGRSE